MPRKPRNSHVVSSLYWLPIFVAVTILGIVITALSLNTLTRQSSEAPFYDDTNYKKIIAIGDIACSPNHKDFNGGNGTSSNCRQHEIARLIQAEKPDAVLLLGDIQYEKGLQADFNESFMKAWPDPSTPFITTPGNHEYTSGRLDGYNVFKSFYTNAHSFGANGETYFATDEGSWRIISIDTNCEYVGGCGRMSKQGIWLQSELKENPRKCSLALAHHPVFTSGLHRLSSQTERAKDFWRQLDEANVDILLAGHDHNYQRYARQSVSGDKSNDGLRQFVVGTGGKSLYRTFPPYASGHEKSLLEFGYLKLLLHQDNYQWSFMTIDGNVADSGREACI